jgi:small-conductance mechanosensitive channel
MRFVASLLAIVIGASAFAQVTPQRPFGQLIDLWTRQLDRVADRMSEPGLLVGELDTLRDQANDVRSAALATAALARDDLADTRKLLAPLEARSGGDPANEAEAVKVERARLQEQASISEGRVKQSEVIIARADQLIERMTRIRGSLMLQTLLHKVPSPLSRQAWQTVGGELSAAWGSVGAAIAAWRPVASLRSGERSLAPLGLWALATLGLWWVGRVLRRRYGRGDAAEPGQRDRSLAAAVDGVGLGLVPILTVWLVGRLLLASGPPPLIETLLPELVDRIIVLMLVFGLTESMLAPTNPAWRVLPFTDDSARRLSGALRRLMVAYLVIDFAYLLLTQKPDDSALASIGALILAASIGVLALPVLATPAWHAARPEGSEGPPLIGGTWWAGLRGVLAVAVLAPIVFAVLGYAAMASHIHAALAGTSLAVAIALLGHRMASDLLEAAAAPDTPSGRWVRHRLGLAADRKLHGQHVVLLLVDIGLIALLIIAVPAAWGADIENIGRIFGRLLSGVKVGGVMISLADIGWALMAFAVALLIAHLLRRIVSNRVMPTIDAPLPLRQSIDTALNYVGLLVAFLVGITSLGVDFTNLAIVLGALSVGIGLGLQNIANNVISGVILLLERPIKAGDWVVVDSHEGFVKRINIRATEIETFQRTSVIVPNSMFLQSAVINRTYSDTSSRVEIQLTVAYDTDVARIEAMLREAALNHPRVLRVPPPIVRFVRIGQHGLDFELFAFVAQLEDRLVVGNDLNRNVLQKVLEAGIEIPFRVSDVRLRDIDTLAQAMGGRTVSASNPAGAESRS